MDTVIEKSEHRQWAERAFPYGKQARKMIINRASRADAWYKDMIGQAIEIHHFGSYGAWDTKGRWVDYWDVGYPPKPVLVGTTWWEILEVPQSASITQIKRAYYLKAQIFHPDKETGTEFYFLKLKGAYEQALKAVSL